MAKKVSIREVNALRKDVTDLLTELGMTIDLYRPAKGSTPKSSTRISGVLFHMHPRDIPKWNNVGGVSIDNDAPLQVLVDWSADIAEGDYCTLFGSRYTLTRLNPQPYGDYLVAQTAYLIREKVNPLV